MVIQVSDYKTYQSIFFSVFAFKGKDKLLGSPSSDKKNSTEEVKVKIENNSSTCCDKLGFLGGLYRGWPVYVKYKILPAGLSLACLYLTVLGFDSITIGEHNVITLIYMVKKKKIFSKILVRKVEELLCILWL